MRSDQPIILESIKFPEPVISVAIEPKTKADQDKMGMALARLAEEDPTFRVRTDEETGQTIISGMGELHLEVIVDRMMREFKVEANVGRPQVAYRETITRPAKRRRPLRPPDRRQGPVRPRLARARAAGARRGLQFRGQDRRRLGPARVHPGRRAGRPRGAWRPASWPAIPSSTSRSTLFDGSYHEVDSSEMAFKIAGSMALKEGVPQGRPGHPGADHAVEVTTPEDFMGDVIGDLNARRGQIEGMEARGNAQVDPRARAAGRDVRLHDRPALDDAGPRATYTMEFDTTSRVPQSIADEIVQKATGSDA